MTVAALSAYVGSVGGDKANRHLKQMRRIFTWGIRQGLVKTNPAERVETVRYEPPERELMPEARLSTVVKDADEITRGILLTAYFGGLKASEIVPLRWRDMDAPRLLVTRSAVEGVVDVPKSRASRRAVLMPQVYFDSLPERGEPEELIFPSSQGKIIRWHNHWQRVVRPLFVEHGLDGFRFHDLRHSNASNLIDSGMESKRIQEQLGHSSIQVTFDRYGHLIRSRDAQVLASLDQLFDGDNGILSSSR